MDDDFDVDNPENILDDDFVLQVSLSIHGILFKLGSLYISHFIP